MLVRVVNCEEGRGRGYGFIDLRERIGGDGVLDGYGMGQRYRCKQLLAPPPH